MRRLRSRSDRFPALAWARQVVRCSRPLVGWLARARPMPERPYRLWEVELGMPDDGGAGIDLQVARELLRPAVPDVDLDPDFCVQQVLLLVAGHLEHHGGDEPELVLTCGRHLLRALLLGGMPEQVGGLAVRLQPSMRRAHEQAMPVGDDLRFGTDSRRASPPAWHLPPSRWSAHLDERGLRTYDQLRREGMPAADAAEVALAVAR